MYRKYLKRLFDLTLTLPALIALSPLMAVLAGGVRIRIGRPVFFRQERLGWQGRLFHILKYRTMTDARDAEGRLLPDEARLTAFGRFLRSTSLDELPELINVLKGEMSIVGPRPLLATYRPRYSPEQMRRHEVRPGLTGWAQVNGRNALDWDERFRQDVWYVEHVSFWLDVRIIALTIWKVMRREGITEPGQATMQEFMGSSK